MQRARTLPLRYICSPNCSNVRMFSSSSARWAATPHETHPPPARGPQASGSHEQQSSRFRWTRERASTAEHGDGDGGFSGQGSMIDTALGIALGTAMLGCGGIAYFSWCASCSFRRNRGYVSNQTHRLNTGTSGMYFAKWTLLFEVSKLQWLHLDNESIAKLIVAI